METGKGMTAKSFNAPLKSQERLDMSPDLVPATFDSAVSVRDLSKKYTLYDSPTHRLREALHPFRKKYHREFWALRDISIDIPRGTTFGIIGMNGSGKSTLLQIISGILQPTTGSVEVNGRISALLELGAGFNKEFTGRENVFMQGAIMGISRGEMEERFARIAEFAEIGHFIDQPAKTYSSGMYVRLAFACAINVDPEILIVDEALAVGDAMFQRRCYRKIEEFQQNGKTIIFVSHAIQTVIKLCGQAVLLSNGKIIQMGDTKSVANTYTQLLSASEEDYAAKLKGEKKAIKVMQVEKDDRLQAPQDRKEKKVSEFRFGSGDAMISEIKILTIAGENTHILEKGETYVVKLVAVFRNDVETPAIGIQIKTLTGIEITGRRASLKPMKAGDAVTVNFTMKISLNPGVYAFSAGVADDTSTHTRALDGRKDVMTFRVYGECESTYGLVDADIAVDTSV